MASMSSKAKNSFEKIFSGLKRQKSNLLEGLRPVTSGVKLTRRFRSYKQSNRVWCCFASSGPGDLL